jgi:hypothetical protein
MRKSIRIIAICALVLRSHFAGPAAEAAHDGDAEKGASVQVFVSNCSCSANRSFRFRLLGLVCVYAYFVSPLAPPPRPPHFSRGIPGHHLFWILKNRATLQPSGRSCRTQVQLTSIIWCVFCSFLFCTQLPPRDVLPAFASAIQSSSSTSFPPLCLHRYLSLENCTCAPGPATYTKNRKCAKAYLAIGMRCIQAKSHENVPFLAT